MPSLTIPLPSLKMFRKRGRAPIAPKRDTIAYPGLRQIGAGMRVGDRKSIPKQTPRNLRYFAKTPVARRAINAIKGPISMLDWEIAAVKGVELNSEIQRQIDVVTACFKRPNNDDSFRLLIEQAIEDIVCGAGAIEQQPSGDPMRPLWMWPVDALGIQLYPNWSGKPNEIRYSQVIGFGTYSGSDQRIDLRNDELIYIRPNPTSASPFGTGQLEVAFQWISRFLATSEFVGNVASNQRPSVGIDLGDVDADKVNAFRAFWQDEVEGQGKVPIVGFPGAPGDAKSRGVNIFQLYPEGDNAMYLKYQEFLIRIIACAFDLSPANLSVEHDVNRSTAEVAFDRDWDHAIRPMAQLLASHLNREAIHGLLGFSQIEFKWKAIDREDEESTAGISKKYFDMSAMTPNEARERCGMPRSGSQWADLLSIDFEIAKIMARGQSVMNQADAAGVPPPDAADDGPANDNAITPDMPDENKRSTKRARVTNGGGGDDSGGDDG